MMKESAEEEAVEGREMEEEEDDEDDEDDDDEDEDEQASAGASQPARDTTSAFEDRENMLRTALVAVSKKGKDSFNCWFHLGLMYFRTQMYPQAKVSFQKSLDALSAQALRHPNKMDPARSSALQARVKSLVAQCSIYELTAPNLIPKEEHNPQLIQEQFIAATKLDNLQPDIWNNIGLLHMSLDKFEGARMILQPILNNFPQYNDAMSNLGLTHMCRNDLSEAARNLQTVILRDANHLEALNNYGVLLLRHRSYSNAAIFFEKAVDLDPSTYVWSNLACAYSGAGRLSDAARAFRHARDLDESNTQATCNLAHHISAMIKTEADPEARAKKLEQAEHMYSSVLSEQKGSTQAWTGLASVFNTLTDLSQDDGKAREYKQLALEAFSRAVECDHRDPVVWTQLGVLSMSDGDYKKAHGCFETALKNTEGILAVWANLALALQLADLPQEAMAVYQQALTSFKDSHQLVNNLGNLHRQMGDLDKAMESYRACVQMKSDYALGYNNMALVHVLREEWDDAAEALGKALEVDPGLDCAKSNAIKLEELRRRAGLRATANGGHAGGAGAHGEMGLREGAQKDAMMVDSRALVPGLGLPDGASGFE